MKYLSYFCLLLATVALIKIVRERRIPGKFALFEVLQERFRTNNSFPGPVLLGLLAGASVVLVPLLLMASAGWARVAWASDGVARRIGLSAATLAVLFLWAATEELIFRGAVLELFLRFSPRWVALTTSALIFACVHLEGGSRGTTLLYKTLPIFLDGIGFGIAYLTTKSLWVPTFWHAAKNISVWVAGSFVLFPAEMLQVSFTSNGVLWTSRLYVISTAVVVLCALVVARHFQTPGTRLEGTAERYTGQSAGSQ